VGCIGIGGPVQRINPSTIEDLARQVTLVADQLTEAILDTPA
jgi:DNA-binding IclR family transcriptional regulator